MRYATPTPVSREYLASKADKSQKGVTQAASRVMEHTL